MLLLLPFAHYKQGTLAFFSAPEQTQLVISQSFGHFVFSQIFLFFGSTGV
jgi:hypothetical protein